MIAKATIAVLAALLVHAPAAAAGEGRAADQVAQDGALPASHDHPRVELASPAKLAAIRYRGLAPQQATRSAMSRPHRASGAISLRSMTGRTAPCTCGKAGAVRLRPRSLSWCTKWCTICSTRRASAMRVRRRATARLRGAGEMAGASGLKPGARVRGRPVHDPGARELHVLAS